MFCDAGTRSESVVAVRAHLQLRTCLPECEAIGDVTLGLVAAVLEIAL